MNEPKPEVRNGVAIVSEPCDVEETGQPFGTRWRQQTVTLNAQHLHVLQHGQYVAVDVQEEYVVFLRFEEQEEAGHGE